MSILDMAKDAVKLVQQMDNIESYRQILNLQAEIQKQFDENLILKQQIADLKEELRIKGSLKFSSKSSGEYYLKREDGTEDGPFCSLCWDTDKKLIRLSDSRDGPYCLYCMNYRKRGR